MGNQLALYLSIFFLWCGLGVSEALRGVARADEASLGVFVRVDSDKTEVIAPRVAAAKEIQSDSGATRIDVAYSADIWSSASIDMRTAATRRIREQRDQVLASASHDFAGHSVGGSYYYSHENDYDAHGLTAFAIQRLAKGSATLEERINYGHDIVGRSGDPGFKFPTNTLGARLVYSQILNPETVLQFAYEVNHKKGYLQSPYRYVGLGGDGLCIGTAVYCVPESHPDMRTRHALVIDSRRSLAEDSALGLGYRFYIDDWGVMSHTGVFQFSSLFGEESGITFRYRFYTQSAASFYKAIYGLPSSPQIGNITRDRELSPLLSNRLALSYDTVFELGDFGAALRMAVAAGATVFIYNNFVGLSDVYSGDLTVALTLEL